MSRVLLALAVCVAVAHALPSGFLLAMVPEPDAANHLWSYAVNPSTAQYKKLQDDYLMASVAKTMNGGYYNAAEKKVQFVGQSLTMLEDGPVPNPTMNFLVSVDNTGDYTSKRMISYGGLVLGVRSTDAGQVFGMEQAVPELQDARLDLVEDTGRCLNIYNTSATAGFNVGHMAIDSTGQRFFVTVKSPSGQSQLQTINLATSKLVTSVDTPNPTANRVTMCYDSVTRGLFSLEQLSGASDTSLVRVDPATGQTAPVATISGKATVGDCRSGFFFVGSSQGSRNILSTVDLQSGAVSAQTLNLSPAPAVLLFFPQ